MKNCITILILFTTSFCFAQQKSSSQLKVISYNSKFITHFTNGQIDDFGTNNKIAYFKDLILYEIPEMHYESLNPTIINPNDERDTIDTDSTDLPVLTKITYTYYIIKKGDTKGLIFENINTPGTPFILDSLMKNNNMNGSDSAFFDEDLDKLISTSKTGNILVEKFLVPNTKTNHLDTVYRQFDNRLIDLDFSISKKLDREKNSKLVKYMYIEKLTPSGTKKFDAYKFILLDEITLVTGSCPKKQLELFQALFNKFASEKSP